MRRILWMKGGALGDFVVGLPVLAALRSAYPRAEIEAVGPGRWLTLTQGWVDRASALEETPWSSLYEEGGTLPARVSALDLAVVLRPDPDGIARANLEHAGVPRVLCRAPLPIGRLHAVEHLAAVLEPLGLSVPPWPEVLHPARGAPKDGTAYIHPGSGGETKRWPAERFRALALALRDRGISPIVVLGPIELERGDAAAWRDSGLEVLSEPALWTLAGRLATASLFVGNDSGVSHLAAAVGCPTVALFGATDPAVWAPRGPRVRVVERPAAPVAPGRVREPMAGLELRTVLAVVDELLSSQASY